MNRLPTRFVTCNRFVVAIASFHQAGNAPRVDGKSGSIVARRAGRCPRGETQGGCSPNFDSVYSRAFVSAFVERIQVSGECSTRGPVSLLWGQIMISSFRRWMLGGLVFASTMIVALNGIAAEPSTPKDKGRGDTAPSVSGREIFLREWIPNDPRSHGGDGLGPVFNDTSCVSCHNQGGVGGGGAESKNVLVITAVRTNFNAPGVQRAAPPRATRTAPD